MTVKIINSSNVEPLLDWSELVTDLIDGHSRPKAQIRDIILSRKDDTLLSRTAWIDGLGQLVKTATIFPKNKNTTHNALGLPRAFLLVSGYFFLAAVMEN